MFGEATDKAILTLASPFSDREICGYVDAAGDPHIVPNIAANPIDEWEMPIGYPPDNAVGVFHSHPFGPACPSGEDMRYQIASDLPHAIVTDGGLFWWGDDVPMPPLLGRAFRHCVTDCYELIRDAYKSTGIELPPFARDWKWWENGQSLYSDGLRPAGFVEIPSMDVMPGDCLLFRIASRVPNHAAVWLGDGLILHHLSSRVPFDPDRRSCVENYRQYGRFLHKTVRYENGDIDRKAFEEIRKITAS